MGEVRIEAHESWTLLPARVCRSTFPADGGVTFCTTSIVTRLDWSHGGVSPWQRVRTRKSCVPGGIAVVSTVHSCVRLVGSARTMRLPTPLMLYVKLTTVVPPLGMSTGGSSTWFAGGLTCSTENRNPVAGRQPMFCAWNEPRTLRLPQSDRST